MKVLIDCGANLGQGLSELHKRFNVLNNPEWEIHAFEPNPSINLNLENISNAKFYQKAIWHEDTTIKFRRSTRVYNYTPRLDNFGNASSPGDLTSVGCHVDLEEIKPENAVPDVADVVEVPAIDFANFLKKFSGWDYDQVVVKMDIEGCEYKVLRHLLNTSTAEIIDILIVETHERFVDSEDKESTNALLDELRSKEIDVEKHH